MFLTKEARKRLIKKLKKQISEQKTIVKTAKASYDRMKKLCYYDDEKGIIESAKKNLEEEQYKLSQSINLYNKLMKDNGIIEKEA